MEELAPLIVHTYGPLGLLCLFCWFQLKEIKTDVKEIKNDLKPLEATIIRVESLERWRDGFEQRGRHGRVTV